MLFALILAVLLPSGEVEWQVLDESLSETDCAAHMAVLEQVPMHWSLAPHCVPMGDLEAVNPAWLD